MSKARLLTSECNLTDKDRFNNANGHANSFALERNKKNDKKEKEYCYCD
jgi:hypothetical protein